MVRRIVLIGIIAGVIIGITSGVSYVAYDQIFVSEEPASKTLENNPEPQNYEDVCGYPVTDEMRLDIISKAAFGLDSKPYLKVRSGNFTHVERSQYLTDEPLLQYWFELKNNKQIYFEIGACDLDGSNMTLTEIGPNYEKPQEIIGSDGTIYQVLAAPGEPLIYKDTLKPVLDYDNCKRVADGYTKRKETTLFTRETTNFDNHWKNQIFPLMDYCASIGNYEMTVVDDKIQWTFTLSE